ncbi:MAG TPA: hypothetical protein VF141_08635 [Chryseolinea sp.]
MARPFFVLLSLSLLLSACTQRLICPAYQSAYIYDQEELRKKFSYFQEDSTPKMLTASKTKYLIAEPVSYRKKLRSMQTVAMKDVNPVLPDSMKVGEEGLMGEDGVVPGAELDLAARSVIDSTYIVDVPQDTTQAVGDSVYVISKDKEVRLLKYNTPDSAVYDETSGRYVSKTPKYGVADVRFNVEQDNYMWYLRKNLVLPDVRVAQSEQQKETKKKKEKKGFFKNLFKRKKKDAVDSTAIPVTPKPEDDFDYVDEDEQQPTEEQVQEEPKKKRGLFKKKEKTAEVGPEEEKPVKEKKKKKEKKPKIDNGDTPKEQEEEDDGF